MVEREPPARLHDREGFPTIDCPWQAVQPGLTRGHRMTLRTFTADDTPATALRGLCDGAVHLPDDPGYDRARTAWNLAVDQRPAAVAVPRDTEDVVAVVRAARAAGLRVAVQSTGHGAVTRGLADAVLVRLDALAGVSVDPDTRRARVVGGTPWREVVDAAAEHGLAALHGSAPDVAVAGYCLGGGLSWYARTHGFAASAVHAVELVTADGTFVRADAEHEPDLFWAVRGGGGAFGVVTALELDLFELAETYAGMLLWDGRDAARVAHAWAIWSRTAPGEATTSLRFMSFPPLPDLPPFLRGREVVVIDGVVLGERPASVIGPLRALGPELDTFATVPATAVSDIHMDPPTPVPALGCGALLDTLPEAAVDALLAVAGPGSGSSLLMAELRQLGVALATPAPGGGALDHADGGYALYCVAMAPTPEAAARGHADAASAVAALSPYGHGRALRNFSEPPDATRCFPAPTLARLREIRAAVDPDATFVTGDWLTG